MKSQILSASLLLLSSVVARASVDGDAPAASELVHWIREVTGTDLSTDARFRVHVGRAAAEKLFPEDLAKIGETDGYAIRSKPFAGGGREIWIFGGRTRGTLFGVSAFIERTTDLIWARPARTVYTKTKGLVLPPPEKLDVLDIPYSTVRAFVSVLASSRREDDDWLIHMRQNRASNHAKPGYVATNDLVREVGGHMFSGIVKGHPEFYAEVNGARKWCGALCLTAPGLEKTYLENLWPWIEKRLPFERLIFGIDDTSTTCQCKDCQKPIVLPDGTTVTKADPAFRSTRWYMFANKVADAVKAKYGIRTEVYSYIYLTVPPKVRISDNIVVVFHPHPRNFKCSYEEFATKGGKLGSDWAAVFRAHRGIAKHFRLREYYGCCGAFPGPREYVARRDIDFAVAEGVRELTADQAVDQPSRTWEPMPSEYWDSQAMAQWVIARLWWNPKADLEALRTEYLAKTFHGAAPAMRRFYDKIRDSWFANPTLSTYQDTLVGSSKEHIVEAGIEVQLRACLEEAEKKADHPVSLELVKACRKVFEKGCQSDARVVARRVTSRPKLMSEDWNGTTHFSDFRVYAHAKERFPVSVTVAMLYDDENLYVRTTVADPSEPDPATPRDVADRYIAKNFTALHFFKPGTAGMAQIAFDRYGNWWDAWKYDLKWNSGVTFERREDAASYDVMATIPLAKIGYEPGADKLNRIKCAFYHNFTDGEGRSWHATGRGLQIDASLFAIEVYLQ